MSGIGIGDVLAARDRIAAHVNKTPLIHSPVLDERLGATIHAKAESLQVTGSFKFRGALNMILQLPADALARGVVAFSSGNHGQGVAAAAKIAGTSAVIVLPVTAAPVKVAACRWWGAQIVSYDPTAERREDVARRFVEGEQRSLIPPFDHEHIIAGQATAGLELCEQVVARGRKPDLVIIPSSGGGLAAGVVLTLRHFFPSIDCVVVEPQGYEKMARSLAAGRILPNPEEARTVMDALIGRTPGERSFAILAAEGVQALSVSDSEALAGVEAGFRYLRLVLEPGGAAALAALVAGKLDVRGRQVALLCSGSNVDAEVFVRALAAPPGQ